MATTAAPNEPGQCKLEPLRVFHGPNVYARSPIVAAALRESRCPNAPVRATMDTVRQSLPAIEIAWPDCRGLASTHAYALLIARLAKGMLNSARGCIEDHGAVASGRNDAVLWIGYHRPELSGRALQTATRWVAWAAGEGSLPAKDGKPVSATLGELQSETSRLLQACARHHPDYIARILMIAARSRGIPVQPSIQPKTWQYGSGQRSARFFEASSTGDSLFDSQTVRDKFSTARLLKHLGYPNSEPREATSIDEAKKCLLELGGPVVVKPPDRGQGQGITVGVNTPEAMEHAFSLAMSATHSAKVLVERFVEGDDHRLLIVRGKLAAAARREPASVCGDGRATLRELVARLNEQRWCDPIQRRYLKKVTFDTAVSRHIGLAGLTPDSVPSAGQKVFLRGNSNVSTGGTPQDVSHLVHPDVQSMAETLALNLGLSSVGIDYMTLDISRPWSEVGGAVIEVNATPGLDLHISPRMDEASMGRIILGEGLGPVPTVLVICSQDRLGHWERQLEANAPSWPANTALATPNLARLGMMPLLPGENLYARVGRCLANQAVAALAVVCPVGTALAGGLPVQFAHLIVIDTPFKDERDLERRLAADARCELLDVGREQLGQRETMERIEHALAASTSIVPLATPEPSTGRPGVSKYRAGEIEFDLLRSLELTGEPTIFCVVRNAMYLLPHFLRHYRELDVGQFVFFDDQSSDGTRELLLQQPDAMVLASSHRFHDVMGNGKALHQNLRNWIPDSLGPGRWVITVDVDEFLVLPAEAPTIPRMAALLDARGHTTVLASMIDFFPPRLTARAHDPGVPPFVASPLFDVLKGFSRNADGRIQKTPGGIRWRLKEWLRVERPEIHQRIFAGQGYLRGASWKSPFVKTGTDTWLINSHSTNRLAPVDLELALAHFKFHPDTDPGITDALATNAHYHASIEYHFLKAAIESFGTRDLACDDTRRYHGRAALEDAGLCWIAH